MNEMTNGCETSVTESIVCACSLWGSWERSRKGIKALKILKQWSQYHCICHQGLRMNNLLNDVTAFYNNCTYLGLKTHVNIGPVLKQDKHNYEMR